MFLKNKTRNKQNVDMWIFMSNIGNIKNQTGQFNYWHSDIKPLKFLLKRVRPVENYKELA